jgi:anti-sigma B factor antagonist
MSETTIDIRQEGSVAILAVHGEVTAASEHALMDAYATASAGDARAILLDFSDLEYMNSGGIGLLVTLLIRVQRAGQRLMAVGLDAHYRQILSLTRLDEAIAIHDSEAAALAAVA